MTMWIAVLGVGVGSYVFRLAPLLVLGRMRLSERAEELLARAGLAAVTALIATSVRSAAVGPPAPAVLAAVGVGTVLAIRRASMVRIVLAGGAVYVAVRLGVSAW